MARIAVRFPSTVVCIATDSTPAVFVYISRMHLRILKRTGTFLLGVSILYSLTI